MVSASAAKRGNQLAGLDFRIKGVGSYERKVIDDMNKKGVTEVTALTGVYDVDRYTVLLNPDDFYMGYNQTIADLRNSGYHLVRVKNSIANKNAEYRGVNTVLIDDYGCAFELQFHTAESLAAKEEAHKIYEKTRKIKDKTSDEFKNLSKRSLEITSKFDTPYGAALIKEIDIIGSW